VYEAADVEPPPVVDGVTQQPIHGKSFAYALDPNSADKPSKRTRQYYEMYGNMVRTDRIERGGVNLRTRGRTLSLEIDWLKLLKLKCGEMVIKYRGTPSYLLRPLQPGDVRRRMEGRHPARTENALADRLHLPVRR
jgi:hypothetical protein